jgi:hypothetical protein
MPAASRRRGQPKLSASCFIVRDSGSQALAYVYYADELGCGLSNYSRDALNSCNAIYARRES